jgi:hypothetical protein
MMHCGLLRKECLFCLLQLKIVLLFVIRWNTFAFLLHDMFFYLSEGEYFDDFGNESALICHETNIPYAVWGQESTRRLSIEY